MGNFKFQLVLQFTATTLDDYDALVKIENALTCEKGVSVDGHDMGMGEFNIFIHTNTPDTTFEQAAAVVDRQIPGIPFSAGYREFAEENYIPLWPSSLKEFSVA